MNASQPRYGIDTVLVISVKRLLPVEIRGVAAPLGRPKSGATLPPRRVTAKVANSPTKPSGVQLVPYERTRCRL